MIAVAIIEILALVMIIVAFAVGIVREKHHPGEKMTPPNEEKKWK